MKTCKTCDHCKAAIHPQNKQMISVCFLNPPTPVMVLMGQGSAIQMVQPIVDQENSFCSHHKEGDLIEAPH